jgi:hypothetical protein
LEALLFQCDVSREVGEVSGRGFEALVVGDEVSEVSIRAPGGRERSLVVAARAREAVDCGIVCTLQY